MSTLVIVATSTVSAVTGAAVMLVPAIWLRTAARLDREHADATYDQATALAETVEATRNLPWHYALPATSPDVTGELVAVTSENVCPECGLLAAHKPTCSRPVSLPWEHHEPTALSAEAHEDERAGDEDGHLGYLVACAVAFVVLAPAAIVRRQWSALVAWFRSRREPRGYTGRHWVADVQHTGAWPIVIPAQREGGDEA